MHHFAYDEAGRLRAEGVELEAIARAVSTPCYVYSRATIERHFRVFDSAFADHPHLVAYSMKANSSQAILNLLGRLGAGADIVSGGELARALAAGIPAERIVFSGVGKRADELAAALDAKILLFNVESEPEIALLDEVARARRAVAQIAFRVNPNIDAKTHPYIATGLTSSKFGIPIGEAQRIATGLRGRTGVELVGIDCHIGSQVTELGPFKAALEAVLALVDALGAEGHAIRLIDLGGGLGVPYVPEGRTAGPPLPSELGRAVVERMRGRTERVILEPGRVILGNAGILLTRVLYVKAGAEKTFVVVDAAMNDLIRPSLYKAHHEIWPVTKTEAASEQVVDVVGPICESSDFFAKDRQMPRVEAGALLAIMGAGAYGFAMASTYNSRPLAAEVMVSGDRYGIIRERQSVLALMAGERVPSFLDEAAPEPKEVSG
jgi:diaminopimelate decarboxylase